MQGKKQYAEKLFTSFQLSNYVPEDNFYRRLKSVLDLQWLYKATKKYYGTEGQQSIDPMVFFKMERFPSCMALPGSLPSYCDDRYSVECYFKTKPNCYEKSIDAFLRHGRSAGTRPWKRRGYCPHRKRLLSNAKGNNCQFAVGR
jgi:hypothetical protein